MSQEYMYISLYFGLHRSVKRSKLKCKKSRDLVKSLQKCFILLESMYIAIILCLFSFWSCCDDGKKNRYHSSWNAGNRVWNVLYRRWNLFFECRRTLEQKKLSFKSALLVPGYQRTLFVQLIYASYHVPTKSVDPFSA